MDVNPNIHIEKDDEATMKTYKGTPAIKYGYNMTIFFRDRRKLEELYQEIGKYLGKERNHGNIKCDECGDPLTKEEIHCSKAIDHNWCILCAMTKSKIKGEDCNEQTR